MATDCNPSLWTATAAMPRFEPLRGDVRTDVLVIGGGIAGLLCARLLTDAGVDMLLVEADRIASGVTARTMLRPQLADNLFEATDGLLTPTARRCPHLGCALHWNPQERSWDCACHGSRFSEDGACLDNPAADGLKKPPKRHI